MSNYGGRDLAAAFRTVRANTIQVAEDIPADQYGFVAAPEVMSVSQMLMHIGTAPWVWLDIHKEQRVTTMKGYDFAGMGAKMSAEAGRERSKEEIIAFLRAEGEKFAAWLETLTPEFLAETVTDPMGENPKTRLEGLMGAKEHEMHHRGQVMLIERILGVVPHLTRRRAEMAKKMAEQQAASQGA